MRVFVLIARSAPPASREILTAVGTGAFVASIYLVVVIGGGALFGRGDVEVALAVVATGLVALS